MLIKYPTTTEAEAGFIRCDLPVRYDDDLEELGADFPGLSGKALTLVLDVDAGAVKDWPAGRTGYVHLKVVDEGSYILLSRSGEVLATRQNYVPSCVPGEYGDYFIASINEDGKIEGWSPNAPDIVQCFWGGDDW